MSALYQVVVEPESNGSFSAWVVGVPGVYAAADSEAQARRAIRGALVAHLDAMADVHQTVTPKTTAFVLRYEPHAKTKGMRLQEVGIGALLGQSRSRAKTAAARRNGRLGGRPRKLATAS